jgi:fructoselysine 6-kinase
MKLVAIGDNVVDCYPQLGTMFPGGNAVNVSVFASQAGAESYYVGAVGTDEAGDLVMSALEAENVDVSHVHRVSGENAFAQVELQNGDRKFVRSGKGVSVFRPTQSDLELLSRADIVHTGHASGLEDFLPEFSSLAPVSFDFSWRQNRAYLERILPFVTFAHFSAAGLTDDEKADLVAFVQGFRRPYVLVTSGARGAEFWLNGRRHYQAAIQTDVIDTLGAGDAFISNLILSTPTERNISKILLDSAKRSATVCQTNGAFGHSKKYKELPGAA